MGDDNYLPKDFDLGRLMFEAANRDMMQDIRIRCLRAAYDKALADPKAILPTYLHAAIEALRHV